jgi:m7GpppX diphosphatase
MLRNILDQGLRSIREVYGVEPERIRVYVHYLPQFFHFHGVLILQGQLQYDAPRRGN